MKFKTLKFKISIHHTAILGLILIVFSGVLYVISKATFQRVDEELTIKAEAIDLQIKTYMNALGDSPEAFNKAVQKTLAMKKEGILPTLVKKITDEWVSQTMGLGINKDYINFYNSKNKEVIKSVNMDKELTDIFIEDIHFAGLSETAFKTLNIHGKSIRVITYPFSKNPMSEYFIQVGVSQDPILQQLSICLVTLVVILPLILLLTGYVGQRQADRILEPVNQITAMAKRITHQDLSARIKAKNFDTEMEVLVNSFNEMIERLERSFTHIEEFSHHVAHELKTPLTIIKGECELLLRKERTKEEYQQALRITLEESDRVLKTIDDLLLLAKLDYKPEIFKFERIDFLEFLKEISEQSRILAASKGASIVTEIPTLDIPVMVNADRLHLRRLFFNIIDNAIKFTSPNQYVKIRVYIQDAWIYTSVTDNGPGIAQENVNKIFEKFFRVNNNNMGNGLGLNIAATIAKLHQGKITVHSRVGEGSTFHIILPIA